MDNNITVGIYYNKTNKHVLDGKLRKNPDHLEKATPVHVIVNAHDE